MDGLHMHGPHVCGLGFWLLGTTVVAPPASGNIDLEWRPASQTVQVGDALDLRLHAVSDTAGNQLLSAVEVIFSWDPTFLELTGLDQAGAVPLLSSGFPTAGDCDLNEVVPPQDGDGFYRAWANLGSPVAATPQGTLLTTFQFTALVGTVHPTQVRMLGDAGACRTVVVDGVIPGLDVTGELGTATVTIGPVPPDEVTVFADIKPRSCPNPLKLRSRGVLTVAVLGTQEFDVLTVDPATVGLSREGVEDRQGNPVIVESLRYRYADVAAPFDGELCDCHRLGPDGFLDLVLKFRRPAVVNKLKLHQVAGQTVPLIVTGNLLGEVPGEPGMPIHGEDCIRILKLNRNGRMARDTGFGDIQSPGE